MGGARWTGHLRIALRTRNLRNIARAVVGRPFAVLSVAAEPSSSQRTRRPWMDDPEWRPSGREPLPDVVRLMPEFSADLPLWDISWDEPDLPRELLVRLTRWQDTFDEHFDPDSGWESEDIRKAWVADGASLQAELREALGPDCLLETDWWPLDVEARNRRGPRP